MATPIILQDRFDRGMRQDEARTQMVKGAVWNLVDLIPNIDDAPLGKRGGWSYGSNDISATKATASYVVAGAYANFSAAAKLCAIDEDGELYTINTSTNAVTDIGAALASLQNPVLHADKLIIPGNDGTTAPKYYDGTTLGNLAGSPPAGKFATVYRDRTVLGFTNSNKTKSYFSSLSDPTTWDTTNGWISTPQPVTGYAALPNALLVFQSTITSRIRGTTPPGGSGSAGSDFFQDDPIFNVGCTDARSIAVEGAFCVFSNPQGVYLSNGTSQVEDLTQSVGLKRYWQSQLSGYAASSWTLGAGIFQNHYVVSIMNGSTFVDCLMFDIPARRAWRLSNVKAVAFWPAVTVQEELYWGSRAAARVNELSSIFLPTSSVKNDANGTNVQPVLETPFYHDRAGKKNWRYLFLSYDMRDAASDNPALRVSYLKTPEGSYTVTGVTPAETTDISDPTKLALRFSAVGVAFKLAQITGPSSSTRIYSLAADAHRREGSRVV